MIAISISLPPHTLNLRSVFETIHEAVAHNLRSKWKRYAWRIPEAQGSDLSGNLFGQQGRGHECFGILANVCGRD
jgi:hypothetical protein